MNDLVNGIIKQFQYYKQLGEKTFSQLSDEELFWQYNENSNSIAIIVNHLSGNIRESHQMPDIMHRNHIRYLMN